jgi:hypothetical protein
MERPRNGNDRELRELLTYLRDSFQDSARRIDDFLARVDGPARVESPARVDARPDARPDARRERTWRDDRDAHGSRDVRETRDAREPREARPASAERAEPAAAAGGFVHDSLEKLREEVRWISQEAPSMDAPLLRLYIEAVTAETRGLQSRAGDPADGDIAAKIMRALTAIVSEHRPGHVYGLARHHQADWDDIARRARGEIRTFPSDGAAKPAEAPAEN